MPDPADPKLRVHPLRQRVRSRDAAAPAAVRYAELHCRSNFSFLRGASHPEELCEQAAALGYHALAITDRNTLAGVVRMHVAAKAHALRLVIGAEIAPVDGPRLVLLPMNCAGYGRLARLITCGRLRVPKGECRIEMADVVEHAGDQIGIVVGRHEGTEARRHEGEGRRHEGTEARRHEGGRASRLPS
jgi:DNA polymerase III alpha subunit